MYDFEIHITTTDITEDQIDQFEAFCASIAAKPIIIELSKGQFYRQPMISKVVKCKDKQGLENEISSIQADFLSNGYQVVRTKIEVPPWHKEIVANYYQNESKTYYEWHGKVKLTDEPLICKICELYQARLSRNTLKNDPTTKFITIRDYTDEQAVNTRIERLKEHLNTHQITMIKEEFEFCIFDSNEALDKDWIV